MPFEIWRRRASPIPPTQPASGKQAHPPTPTTPTPTQPTTSPPRTANKYCPPANTRTYDGHQITTSASAEVKREVVKGRGRTTETSALRKLDKEVDHVPFEIPSLPAANKPTHPPQQPQHPPSQPPARPGRLTNIVPPRTRAPMTDIRSPQARALR